MNVITYMKVGDYLLPIIRLSVPPNVPPPGRCGMMHNEPADRKTLAVRRSVAQGRSMK